MWVCVSVLRPRERGNSLLVRCVNIGRTEELYGMLAAFCLNAVFTRGVVCCGVSVHC